MSMFESQATNDARTRVLAKQIKRCKVTEVRSMSFEAKDGKPACDTDFVTFALQEPATTTDGEQVAEGFVVEHGFNEYKGIDGQANYATANRISAEGARKFIIAALKLDPATKDVVGALKERGGPKVLEGKLVNVEFSVGKGGRQNVDGFGAVAE